MKTGIGLELETQHRTIICIVNLKCINFETFFFLILDVEIRKIYVTELVEQHYRQENKTKPTHETILLQESEVKAAALEG